jgi:GcrA cell cycle regulator
MSTSQPWSEGELRTLRDMWADGASATEISKALGGIRSRNSVLGMGHRMKLPARRSPLHTTAAQREEARARREVKVKPPADRREQNGGNLVQKMRAQRTGQKHRNVAPPMAGNARAKAMLLGEGPPSMHAEPTQIRSEVWHALPGTEPVPLTDRTGCHWPIGADSPFLMCNAEIESGVYCATHNRTSRSAYNVRR